MLDALSYLKAARALGVPAALEVSRSGIGAHVWIFFSGPVSAATARTLGSGLLREPIALRGRMDLSSYDRLFPSQDALPASGSVGNLIAAPLQGRSRKEGATVFLDLGTLEPHEDQWAYLSSLHRLSPREVDRLAARVGPVRVGAAVDRLTPATATRIRPHPAPLVRVTLGAGVSVEISRIPSWGSWSHRPAREDGDCLRRDRSSRDLDTRAGRSQDVGRPVAGAPAGASRRDCGPNRARPRRSRTRCARSLQSAGWA
jgi:hypothetical protein